MKINPERRIFGIPSTLFANGALQLDSELRRMEQWQAMGGSKMTDRRASAARRMVDAYVNEFDDDPVIREHRTAMKCWDFEAYLAAGNSAFNAVNSWADAWTSHVFLYPNEFDNKYDQEIVDAYKEWLQPCEWVLVELRWFDEQDYHPKGSDEFKANLELAKSIASGETQFHIHSLKRLRDEALRAQAFGFTPKIDPGAIQNYLDITTIQNEGPSMEGMRQLAESMRPPDSWYEEKWVIPS